MFSLVYLLKFRFVELSRVYHTRQVKNTPDKVKFAGWKAQSRPVRALYRPPKQKDPTRMSRVVLVEHCPQHSKLYAGISLLRSVRFKPRNGGTSARFNPCS